MPKVWLYACIISGAILLPQAGSADGVNTGLSDPQVIAPTPQVIGPASQSPLSARLGVPAVLPGSNQVGRRGGWHGHCRGSVSDDRMDGKPLIN